MLDGITIDEFETLPLALVKNHELVNGKLIDVSERTFYHNCLRDHLMCLLADHVEAHGLGKIICEQDYDFEGNAHAPDVTFISAAKLHRIKLTKRVQPFVPDLAVEIAAKNDTFVALLEKTLRYRRCGTRDVWILSPDTRQALVQSDDHQAFLSDDEMFESKLIPGISIRLADLFDRA